MNTLFCDAHKLERKLNRPVPSLDSLSSLVLKSAQIAVVEDCSALVNLTTADLSGNLIATREGLQGLLRAPVLASLDLRGCPIASTENYRRWVIARAPATLKMLDGKEVSALERRYAFNLFPELRPKEAVAPVPAAAVRPAALGDDELFGADVAKKVVTASAARPPAVGAAEIFAASPKSASASFGGFFPATAIPVTTAAGGPVVAAAAASPAATEVVALAPAPVVAADTGDASSRPAMTASKDDDDTLFATFPMELGSHKKDKLLDNDVVKSRDEDVLEQDLRIAKPTAGSKVRPAAATVAAAVVPVPVVVAAAAAVAPAPSAAPVEPPVVAPVPATSLSRDVVLDNDLMSGRSFFDSKAKDSVASVNKKKTSASVTSSTATTASPAGSASHPYIGSMFFETDGASATAAASASSTTSKRAAASASSASAARNAAPVSVFEEQSMYSPLGNADSVQFGGSRTGGAVLPASSRGGGGSATVVQTYNASLASEVGETVSYGVEQVMAYVLNGFHPSTDNAAAGLFEFTVQLKDAAPDVFHVRVTSPAGVSVHAGRVPAPEAWATDCKLTLTEDVMQDMLNGKTDPASALLNGYLHVEGQLPKLLLFREVFHFALARFNAFRTRWNSCVRDEETDMANRARGKQLDDDFAESLQFLLYAWRGTFPPSWRAGQVAYVLLGLLPDNVYHKGYRSNVVVAPPKVLLRMTAESLEFVTASDGAADGGSVMCEIWGKKAVLVALFTGRTTLSQTLALLSAPPPSGANPANAAMAGDGAGSRHVYAHSPWRDPENEPSMWAAGAAALSTGKVPPLLFVRNLSHFDGVNDFEEIMRCFDINVLTFDRFRSAQRSDANAAEADANTSAALKSVRLPTSAAVAVPMAPSPIASLAASGSAVRARSSSPLEFLEMLKGVKTDITKRLNATSPTARSPPRLLTEAGKQLGEMGPMRGGSPSSNGSSASDRGAVPQLFSRAFDDYEV